MQEVGGLKHIRAFAEIRAYFRVVLPYFTVFQIESVILEILACSTFSFSYDFYFAEVFFRLCLCMLHVKFESSTTCASMCHQSAKVPHEFLDCLKSIFLQNAHVECIKAQS